MSSRARKRKKAAKTATGGDSLLAVGERVQREVLAQMKGAAELAESDPAAFRQKCRDVGAELNVAAKKVAEIVRAAAQSPAMREKAIDGFISEGAKFLRSRLGL